MLFEVILSGLILLVFFINHLLKKQLKLSMKLIGITKEK